MVQPDGEADSRGKAVVFEIVESSDSSTTEYHCPRCSKTFSSTHSLCAHQNAHRLVKEPMKMSPVMAAVLNNPPPPFHKPFLLPQRPKLEPRRPANRAAAAREAGGSKKPEEQPATRVHPYSSNPNQLQNNSVKRTTTGTPEGGGLMFQLLQNQPLLRGTMVLDPDEQEGYTNSTDTAVDLLGEWRPITAFKEVDVCLRTGTFSGKKRARAAGTERESPDLELSLRLPGARPRVDLRLKLGF